MTLRQMLALGMLAGAAALGWYAFHGAGDPAPTRTLMVYCAAGLKKPVEEIKAAWEKETGIEVSLQYGGTGTLMSQIEVARRGDLFIAADAGAAADAAKRGLVEEQIPLVRQKPVIAVPSGNPKGVKAFADLLRPDLRVALANPEAASIGRATQAAAGAQWEALKSKVAVMKPTVTDIASDLTLGAVDAAVLWDATVPQFKGIEAVQIPEFASRSETAMVCVLKSCEQPALALRLARYFSAPEKGAVVFAKQGFTPESGDAWAATPEIILYSGAVNRPAVEPLVNDFIKREGVSITTVYNGCGILCSAMKAMQDQAAPKLPDAYYACDVCFVPPVADLFPEAIMLTETPIVIAVPEGNPLGIHTLADLAREGLRLGICNAEQSTLGFMTRGLLRKNSLEFSVRKNVAVEVPTADFLINQLRAGGLDAAIVYLVNVENQKEHLDAVPILDAGATAVQPFAVRKDSSYRLISQRLLRHFQAHPESFKERGFTWRDGEKPMQSKDIEVPPWLKPDGAK